VKGSEKARRESSLRLEACAFIILELRTSLGLTQLRNPVFLKIPQIVALNYSMPPPPSSQWIFPAIRILVNNLIKEYHLLIKRL
jgi:hypothetical protein